MTKTILTIAFLLTIGQTALAQNFDQAKLDSYFQALEAHNKFMGSVAVSKNGTIIYKKSVGFADLKNQVKASELSKYRIGSISKTFTAVLVLKAVEDKKLTLQQTLDKWFPTIPNAHKITLQHLLRHRSGIHNFTENEDFLSWNTQAKTKAEMVEIISKGGSVFEPDTQAEYSNSNYVLLSYILEAVYGKPYAEILQTYIVQPVGLQHTYVFGKINTQNNECKSYNFIGNWKEESETDFTIPLGAGAIVSAPTDLTKFADALFAGKLLQPESLETMKTVKDGFGLGLFPIPFYDKSGYGHTGGIDGFRSVYAHFDDGNISYALSSNGTMFDINDISIAVLSAIYGKPYDIPTFSKSTYEVRSSDLDQYLGVYATNTLPLKITVTKEGHTLVAQATGQSSFPLEAIEKDRFQYEEAGIIMEFNPQEKTMLLHQGGGKFVFTKE